MTLLNPRAFERPNDKQPARLRKIAMIGNYLPRRCGIATFTTDSWHALRDRFPDLDIDLYAMTDRAEGYDYPAEVTMSIAEQDPLAYAAAARHIAHGDAQLVWLQHEFGIFGGEAGDHILRLLDRVDLPLVVTLHTILEQPNPAQRRVIDALLNRAAKVIVMAEAGRDILVRRYGASPMQIAVVKHGIPNCPFAEPETAKASLGLQEQEVVLTFGLLSPDKGIETMIEALPEIVARARRPVTYVILGATHPHLLAREGEAYRERLQAQAARLGVEGNIRWVDAFVSIEELTTYLTATDVYVTPYLNPAQITSGTLSYAVGLGKPVVSTPYAHARELLADDHGVLVEFRDDAGFAREIGRLLSDATARAALRNRAYALGRTMIWPRYAEAVMQGLGEAVRTAPVRIATTKRGALPVAVSFQAIERLSDSTGICQHSLYSVPDRSHGYCVDDNARALLLMNRSNELPAVDHDRWAPIYASFVQYAWNADRGAFRNFMSYDRQWLEEVGSDDSFGRTLWAIGTTARDNRLPQLRKWGSALFDQVAGHAMKLEPQHSAAFAILGAAAMAEAHPGHALATAVIRIQGERMLDGLAATRRDDWIWFEHVLGYDNCRMPEALLHAGAHLDRPDMIAAGLESLEWIISRQTAPEGHFRAIGTESFSRPFARLSEAFDQQPLEAWATIDACASAEALTGDSIWHDRALTAYRWFLGDNDLGLALADPATGECFDGLMPGGLNLNQGAESVLAFQLASESIRRLCSGNRQDRQLSLVLQ